MSTACFIAGLLLYPFCEKLEYRAYDLRMKAVSAFFQQPYTPHVVVVAIHEKSILAKKPFVFWYPEIGRFYKFMGQFGAKAVGLDLIPVHSLEEKFGSAFLGVDLSEQKNVDVATMGKALDQLLLEGLMEAAATLSIVQGVSGATVPFYYDLLAFMEHASPASLRLQPDHDTIIRSQPRQFDKDMLSFTAELIRVSGHQGSFPENVPINYRLLPGIPVIDFEQVLSGSADSALFKNKIVILGVLSPFDDVHETAVGPHPGMLIHATTLETLLTGKTLVHSSSLVSLALLAVLAVVSFPLSVSRSPLRSILYLTAFTILYVSVNTSLFANGIIIPVFPHAGVPLIMFCILYPYRYVIEERGKRKLYETFSYYVSPEVIDRLVTGDPDRLMKGERHNVCIMFLDIRGFTALSEKYESESIVAMLNSFFGHVTESVQSHKGFVNKFIGDGMLAFFTGDDNYIDDAIEASKEICRLVTELNASGAMKQFIGDDTFAIGIGLHAGSVILGNIGSKRKMDFTVIGRAVNVASRIESLTKEYSRSILVSSEVKSMAGSGAEFESLGMTHVKGIAGEVEVFGLLQ